MGVREAAHVPVLVVVQDEGGAVITGASHFRPLTPTGGVRAQEYVAPTPPTPTEGKTAALFEEPSRLIDTVVVVFDIEFDSDGSSDCSWRMDG